MQENIINKCEDIIILAILTIIPFTIYLYGSFRLRLALVLMAYSAAAKMALASGYSSQWATINLGPFMKGWSSILYAPFGMIVLDVVFGLPNDPIISAMVNVLLGAIILPVVASLAIIIAFN